MEEGDSGERVGEQWSTSKVCETVDTEAEPTSTKEPRTSTQQTVTEGVCVVEGGSGWWWRRLEG